MENTFVTRMEDSEYLVITNNNDIVETAKMKFTNVKIFNVTDENNTIVNKMITFESSLQNAYHVRQTLGLVENGSNKSAPKDEIDVIAESIHIQRNTLIAVAFGQAKANSITKVKKQLGNDFDDTILKVKSLME